MRILTMILIVIVVMVVVLSCGEDKTVDVRCPTCCTETTPPDTVVTPTDTLVITCRTFKYRGHWHTECDTTSSPASTKY